MFLMKHTYLCLYFCQLLDSSVRVLSEQPIIVDKTYLRQGFAFNGTSIKIVFTARQEKANAHYAGFRAVVTATTSK